MPGDAARVRQPDRRPPLRDVLERASQMSQPKRLADHVCMQRNAHHQRLRERRWYALYCSLMFALRMSASFACRRRPMSAENSCGHQRSELRGRREIVPLAQAFEDRVGNIRG